MNFLALCKSLRQEASLSGAGPTTVESTVPAEMQRVINWVATSWTEIQEQRDDWRFLRFAFSKTITASSPTIAVATDYKKFKEDSGVMTHPNGSVSQPDYVDPDTFTHAKRLGHYQPSGTPIIFTVHDDGILETLPAPDGSYTFDGDYFRTPQILTKNIDIALLPVQYHMLIVYFGLMKYGAWDESPNHYARGETEYDRIFRQVVRTQTPRITLPGPLA